MNGRVLSEEEVRYWEERFGSTESIAFWVGRNLIATIRDRDKTIAELQQEVKTVTACCELNQDYVSDLSASNRALMDKCLLMLSALEAITYTGDECGWMARNKAKETLTQIKGGDS